MTLILSILVSLIVGFVVGALVYKNNAKMLQGKIVSLEFELRRLRKAVK